jgi:magnesium-transporting ATPase (P-type)
VQVPPRARWTSLPAGLEDTGRLVRFGPGHRNLCANSLGRMAWNASDAPEMQELKSFVLSNVNHRLGHDVQEHVMPEFDRMGKCEGIASRLGGSLTEGIKETEVQQRQDKYGINYIEPDPPTPFLKFCLDALEDFTLRLLLFFALISTV